VKSHIQQTSTDLLARAGALIICGLVTYVAIETPPRSFICHLKIKDLQYSLQEFVYKPRIVYEIWDYSHQ